MRSAPLDPLVLRPILEQGYSFIVASYLTAEISGITSLERRSSPVVESQRPRPYGGGGEFARGHLATQGVAGNRYLALGADRHERHTTQARWRPVTDLLSNAGALPPPGGTFICTIISLSIVTLFLTACESLNVQQVEQATVAAADHRYPNIVFVVADQMRAHAMGAMGNRQVITPNLDKLAAEGLLITNAISGQPVCTPFRAQLMTGRYSHSTGVIHNDKGVSI